MAAPRFSPPAAGVGASRFFDSVSVCAATLASANIEQKSFITIPGRFSLIAGTEKIMLQGYEDLRNELTEIFAGDVTEQDIDAAVRAIINEDNVTATPALSELNTLAQSEEGKEKLRSMLATWIMHERDRKDIGREHKAISAIDHLLDALGVERRKHAR
jgi:hypothetical protein